MFDYSIPYLAGLYRHGHVHSVHHACATCCTWVMAVESCVCTVHVLYNTCTCTGYVLAVMQAVKLKGLTLCDEHLFATLSNNAYAVWYSGVEIRGGDPGMVLCYLQLGAVTGDRTHVAHRAPPMASTSSRASLGRPSSRLHLQQRVLERNSNRLRREGLWFAAHSASHSAPIAHTARQFRPPRAPGA